MKENRFRLNKSCNLARALHHLILIIKRKGDKAMNHKPKEILRTQEETKDKLPIDSESHTLPSPPLDGKKPIPAGEVEKFLVTTDTSGGE